MKRQSLRRTGHIAAQVLRTIHWTVSTVVVAVVVFADPEEVRPWFDKLPGAKWLTTPLDLDSWQGWVIASLVWLGYVGLFGGLEVNAAWRRKRQRERRPQY